MTKKITEEFDLPTDKIAIFLVSGAVYLFVVSAVFDSVIEKHGWGSFEFYLGLVGMAFSIFGFLRLMSPRCPNCGQGLFSVLELGKWPIILKTWVGKKCWGCGAGFKT